MSMTDPIADMLARIRNAIRARKDKVEIPSSNLKERIVALLRDEGFIKSYRVANENSRDTLVVQLRYDDHNRSTIEGLRRVSRPGQRAYVGREEIPRVRSGLGVAILSTSEGVMTDREARKQLVGGEVLCEVW
jgi:small subunit ribosomal protein S8